MLLEDRDNGSLLDLLGLDEILENRRLEDAESNPQSDAHQNDREREGYAPTPGEELIAGELAGDEHGKVGQEQAARHAELRPGRDQPTLTVGARPFHRQQHRTAPLAAHADALEHSQHG